MALTGKGGRGKSLEIDVGARMRGPATAHVPLIVVLTLVSLGALIPFLEREPLLSLFFDDAFYYFAIARNVVEGHGFTFDGVHPTNGFHPLWLVTLLPVFALVPGDVLPLRIIALLEVGLVAAALAQLYRSLSRSIPPSRALLAALLPIALPGSWSILRGGLETALLFLLLVLIWNQWRRLLQSVEDSFRSGLLLGGLCTLAALARLEAVTVPVALVLLGWKDFLLQPRRAAAVLTLPGAAVGAYLTWSRLAFGTWMPISGAVKAFQIRELATGEKALALLDFPWLGRDLILWLSGRPMVSLLGGSSLMAYVAVVLVTAVAIWRTRAVIGRYVRQTGTGLLLLVSLLMLTTDLLTLLFLPPWYRLPILLISTLLVAAWLSQWAWLARMGPVICVILILVRVPLMVSRASSFENSHATHRVRAADWIRENTEPEARIASWNAGMLGYFSHRQVVNLDGLVNDERYFHRVIRNRRLGEYLAEEDVSYVADQTCAKNPSLLPYLSRTGNGKLEDNLHLTAVFGNPHHPQRCPGFGVWEFR